MQTPESIAEQFIGNPTGFAEMFLQVADIANKRVEESERLVSMIHELQRQNHALQQQNATMQRQMWEKDRLLMELQEMASHYRMLTVH